jgi:hypothetical protein
MDFHDALKRLQGDEGFKTFLREHPSAFLAHAFWSNNQWQLGYFHDDTMTTFVIETEIKQLKDQEILRTEHEIKRLDDRAVGVTMVKALEIAEVERKKHYPAEMPLQTFFIIQDLGKGPIYNVTLFTKSFKTINIKLSAKDGTVLKHSVAALFEMDKFPMKK